MKNQKAKTERKTISLQEFDNMLEKQLKLTRFGGIAGVITGTGFLAAGIFLPKEINPILEKILEFSAAGLSYASAVGSYILYRKNQIQTTEFHSTPQYLEELRKTIMDE